MTIDVKVPTLPESVPDATLLDWKKKVGDAVEQDEILVELETDKVVLEVPAPEAGVLSEILLDSGDTAVANDVLARIDTSAKADAAADASAQDDDDAADAGDDDGTDDDGDADDDDAENDDKESDGAARAADAARGGDSAPSAKDAARARPPAGGRGDGTTAADAAALSPAVRKLVDEHGLDPSAIDGTGKGGRITKGDVLAHLEKGAARAPAEDEPAAATPAGDPAPAASAAGARAERREPMSRLRQRIAERLVSAQHTAAILTTFNEVNMEPVMALRNRHKERFEKVHGVRLGFMSFFAKAAVAALQRFPAVNAYIEGTEMVFHDYCDIGVAVGSPRGLVVPVLRNVEDMSFADIERAINGFGERAKSGQLTVEEMTGGTFTISNGGVFGSMLSTPILNPPQSAILGMHKTQERAVVEDGEIVVRPMMYLALSYDHRIVDGREAVLFLVTIKEALEDPGRLLLEV